MISDKSLAERCYRFPFHLELDLGVCDGTKEEYLKQRVVDED